MRMTARQYAQALFDLTDGKSKPEIEKTVDGFAHYIYRNRKLKLASKIIEQFSAIYNRKKGIIEAEVVTAEKLSAAMEKRVKGYIEKKYRAKEAVLKNIIDESIKGGMIVKMEDEVIDSSISGKIKGLRRLLVGK